VDIYTEIYNKYHNRKEYAARFEEIDIIGSAHYEAEDEKKTKLSPEENTRNEWRRQ
jgi:hypothetical protein